VDWLLSGDLWFLKGIGIALLAALALWFRLGNPFGTIKDAWNLWRGNDWDRHDP